MLLSPACHYWAASASRTGKSLALGGSDTLIHVIDAAARHETALLTGHADDIVAVAFSPTEEHALISLARVARAETSAFDLFVWDVSAATKLAAATGQGVAFDARWAPDGASFVVACRGRCEVFDRRAASAATLSFAGDVVACYFSPTAAFVAAAAGVSVSVAAAAVSAGTPPTFAAHPERVNDVHWACGCVASAGDDGAVTLFDERTGALAKRIQAHGDICKTVRIADGVVLTGAEDRTARLFRLSGEEAVLRGHSAAVALVAHLPGGKTCLTASENGSCRIWDYARAFAQDTAPGSDKAIAAVVFVEGGLIVADGGGVLRRFEDDGKKKIWHTEPWRPPTRQSRPSPSLEDCWLWRCTSVFPRPSPTRHSFESFQRSPTQAPAPALVNRWRRGVAAYCVRRLGQLLRFRWWGRRSRGGRRGRPRVG